VSGRDDNDTRRNNHGGTGDPTQWRTGNGGDFTSGSTSGRWPANLILDSEAAAMLDAQSGNTRPGHFPRTSGGVSYFGAGNAATVDYANNGIGDSGGASRFFFRADYDEGEMPVG